MSQKIWIQDGRHLFTKPCVKREQVERIASEHFGLIVDQNNEIKELDSYDDRNFLITGAFQSDEEADHMMYVLKVTNSYETKLLSTYEMISKLLLHILKVCGTSFDIPQLIACVDGNRTCVVVDFPVPQDFVLEGGSLDEFQKFEEVSVQGKGDTVQYKVRHIVRLFRFIPGTVLTKENVTQNIAYQWGKLVSKVDGAMKSFGTPSHDDRSDWLWNLLNASKALRRPYVSTMQNQVLKDMITDVLNKFAEETLTVLKRLPKQLIHGDANDQNILINDKGHVIGLIDFNDIVVSYRVVELATIIMYVTAVSTNETCLQNAKRLYEGYTSEQCLEADENRVLYNLVLVRHSMSYAIANYQYHFVETDNEYLMVTAKHGCKILEYLFNLGQEKFNEFLFSEEKK